MNVRSVISRLMEFSDMDTEVFVRIITRDSEGNVLEATNYPISCVYSTRAEIIIEK